MSFTIAIDGPAAAGKGTLSKSIAQHLGFHHLDTGLLYRAVGARVLDGEQAVTAARALSPQDLQRTDLRRHDVAQAASQVATLTEVRTALTEFQRQFAQKDPGAVLDGRDIGTVIVPNANLKLFVTASVECRAQRRFRELQERGENVSFDQVVQDMTARDERDQNRSVAPLKPADNAHIIDTSNMSALDVFNHALSFVNSHSV